jgi:mRNA-degrading endonuclease RelE of RelBE toxin-antitoxin system
MPKSGGIGSPLSRGLDGRTPIEHRRTSSGGIFARQYSADNLTEAAPKVGIDREKTTPLTYISHWRILCGADRRHTRVFTRQVVALLPDETYRELQIGLVDRPDWGTVIPGSGGLRKLRWGAAGRGKRSGVRVIYYWAVRRDTIVLLFLYPKNAPTDLSSRQLRDLRTIIEEEYP